ncbi:hypothetical protein K501DRAFT_280058 [Backusella circina FSU 941]|nr:hypothetical protein K501DRAFT_280058 [Backusella circina FSU 941]
MQLKTNSEKTKWDIENHDANKVAIVIFDDKEGGVEKVYADRRMLKGWRNMLKSIKVKDAITVLDLLVRIIIERSTTKFICRFMVIHLYANYYENRKGTLLSLQNNTSQNIPLSSIPPIQQEWTHSVLEFTKKAIRLLQEERKLSNFKQALTLNGIYFIAPEFYKHYGVCLEDWCHIVQNYIRKYQMLSISDVKLSSVENCIEEFGGMAYIHFPEIQTLPSLLGNTLSNSKVLNMLDNASRTIKIDEDSENDDEDTFIMINNIKYYGNITEMPDIDSKIPKDNGEWTSDNPYSCLEIG